MIKKLTIRVLVIVMTITLLGIIYVQWMWINNAIDIRKQQFKERIDYILRNVVSRIELDSYARFYSKVEAKLKSVRIYNDEDNGVNSRNIVDSLMMSSGYFMGTDGNHPGLDESYMGMFNGRNVFHSLPVEREFNSSKMLSQIVESAIKKFNITQTESPEQFESIKKSLSTFLAKILRESDTRNLSTEERLIDIPVLEYLNNSLGAEGINFSYKLIDLQTRDSLLRNIEKDNVYIKNPFPGDIRKAHNFICVTISEQNVILLRSISWLLVASGLCILFLCVVFGFTVFVILRQKKLSEVKNDFINNMTHEFKTPIATISLATSAITNPKVIGDKEQIIKFNDMVKKENQRMHRHVEKILQQARLDRKEVDLRKEEININDLITEACEHFMLQCKDKGVKLMCESRAKEPILVGDEVHILNCIINLIDNSIKYSKEDPKILVYSKDISKGIVLGVRDNGVGMSRDSQKMVFTRFYRVTDGNIHNVKGFGLGLSYVKSIVTAHNGSIYLRSKLNKGTTIELVFPKK